MPAGIAEVLACRGVDLIGIELQRPGERQQLLAQGVRALGFAIMASAVTSQKEQMVNVPSSSSNPVSVSLDPERRTRRHGWLHPG
jgi:hypothetical protein